GPCPSSSSSSTTTATVDPVRGPFPSAPRPVSTPPLPRDQFPVADRYPYLNHARVAAPPRVVAHALARDASGATMLGSISQDARRARVDGVRRTAAGLLGVAADDLTFVRNTTEGLAVLAASLPWSP